MAKKSAGAGRGFVNPQRTDENDSEYVTPKQHYDMQKQVREGQEAAGVEKAYEKSRTTPYAKGGMTASSRGDGCCTKGKTKGRFV